MRVGRKGGGERALREMWSIFPRKFWPALALIEFYVSRCGLGSRGIQTAESEKEKRWTLTMFSCMNSLGYDIFNCLTTFGSLVPMPCPSDHLGTDMDVECGPGGIKEPKEVGRRDQDGIGSAIV